MRFEIGTSFRQAMLPKGFLCLFACLSMAACTRPQNSTASVQISFPSSFNSSLGTGSTAGLKHAIIQITGSGMTPVYCSYDSGNNITFQGDCATDSTVSNNTTQAAAGTFMLSVPQGSGRVIQAIAVYNDLSDAGMTIFYGDTTQDINGDQAVGVTVAQVATSVVSGRVMGRYMTSSDAGPTGLLNAFYVPGPGKPRVLVDTTPMMNGWMTAMMLSGLPLLYAVNDGTPPPTSTSTTTTSTTTTTTGVTTTSTTVSTSTTTTLPSGAASGETILWGGQVSLDSSIFSSSTAIARAALPPSIRKTMDSLGNTTIESVDPTIYVWGYFGTNASFVSSKTVCVDTAAAFQNLKVYSASPTAAIYASSAFMTATTATAPATGALVSTSTALSNVYFNGGMAATTTPCTSATAATLFSNVYKVGVGLVDGNGNDGASGYRMPFTIAPLMNVAATVTVGGTPPVVIVGQLLPGVQAAGTAVTAFKGLSSGTYYNSFDCTQLPSGFTAAGSGSVDSNGNFSISTSITAAEVTAGATAVVLCPANFPKAGQFLNSYLIHSGSPQPATHFTVNLDAPIIGTNQCHKMFLNLLSASNGPGYSTSAQTFAISLSSFSLPSAFQFYSDSSCTMPLSSQASYVLPAMSLGATFYAMGTNAETGSPSIMFNDSPLGTPQTVSLQVRTPSVGTNFSSPRLTLTAGQCQDVTVFVQDAVGTTASPAAATTVSISAGSTGIQVVSSCANPSAAVSNSIPSGADSISFGVVANATVGSGEYVTVTDTTPGALHAGAVMVNTNMVNSLIQRASTGGAVGVTGTFVSGICEQMVIHRQDASSNDITSEGVLPYSVQITSTGGATLYSDSACTVGGATSLTGSFATGQGSKIIYLKESALNFSTADNVTFSLSVTGANGSSTSNYMYKPVINVSPGTLTSTCTTATVILARQGDLAPLPTLPLTSVTWMNNNASSLGIYNNLTDCGGLTNAVMAGSLNSGVATFTMKNLSGTSGTASLSVQATSSADQVYLGNSGITIAVPLTP